MANRAEIILRSIKDNCSDNIYTTAKALIIDIEKSTPAKQGKYIKTCLEMLDSNDIDLKKVMRPCSCISDSVIQKAKKFYHDANGDINAFLGILNTNHIGVRDFEPEYLEQIIAAYFGASGIRIWCLCL